MAKALIQISDTEDGKDIELQVKFFPAVDNNSPAHQAVAEFVKLQNLQEVPKAEG
jgi:hypothetical protein